MNTVICLVNKTSMTRGTRGIKFPESSTIDRSRSPKSIRVILGQLTWQLSSKIRSVLAEDATFNPCNQRVECSRKLHRPTLELIRAANLIIARRVGRCWRTSCQRQFTAYWVFRVVSVSRTVCRPRLWRDSKREGACLSVM